ncbi:MAG: hypothetical protein Q8P35_00465 [Candidatus Yanofskybacteria bacterium]|nr:hypothetical protein [Candidatus Yanofskybacteria bacterium]
MITKSFGIPGYLHETREEVQAVIERAQVRNIHNNVRVQHEDDRRLILEAWSSSHPMNFHDCSVLVEVEEIPGRQTEVTVRDNHPEGKCARDGHIEEIAGRLEEQWQRDYAYGARHRRS